MKRSVILEILKKAHAEDKPELHGREILEAYKKLYPSWWLSYGSMYSILDRMEEAGLVVSRESDALREYEGHQRRFYKLAEHAGSAK